MVEWVENRAPSPRYHFNSFQVWVFLNTLLTFLFFIAVVNYYFYTEKTPLFARSLKPAPEMIQPRRTIEPSKIAELTAGERLKQVVKPDAQPAESQTLSLATPDPLPSYAFSTAGIPLIAKDPINVPFHQVFSPLISRRAALGFSAIDTPNPRQIIFSFGPSLYPPGQIDFPDRHRNALQTIAELVQPWVGHLHISVIGYADSNLSIKRAVQVVATLREFLKNDQQQSFSLQGVTRNKNLPHNPALQIRINKLSAHQR